MRTSLAPVGVSVLEEADVARGRLILGSCLSNDIVPELHRLLPAQSPIDLHDGVVGVGTCTAQTHLMQDVQPLQASSCAMT